MAGAVPPVSTATPQWAQKRSSAPRTPPQLTQNTGKLSPNGVVDHTLKNGARHLGFLRIKKQKAGHRPPPAIRYLLRAPTTTRAMPPISAIPLRTGGIGTSSFWLWERWMGPTSASFFSFVKENPPIANPTIPIKTKIIPTMVVGFIKYISSFCRECWDAYAIALDVVKRACPA